MAETGESHVRSAAGLQVADMHMIPFLPLRPRLASPLLLLLLVGGAIAVGEFWMRCQLVPTRPCADPPQPHRKCATLVSGGDAALQAEALGRESPAGQWGRAGHDESFCPHGRISALEDGGFA